MQDVAPRFRGSLKRLVAPTLLDIFFVALLVSAFALPQGTGALLSDGDTGWHIRTGELILQTRRAPDADPFSFTKTGQPWFAWEWLADVCFAAMFHWRGLAGVAALAGIVLSLSATILFGRMLRCGCGLWIALAATMTAISASSVHFLARPHVFSILLYVIALALLAEDRVRPGWPVWVLIPLTALWANLHGGFVAWFATLGLLLVVYTGKREWVRLKRYAVLTTLCAAASLINPYGWRLHQHILQYLTSSWISEHVQEFQSPAIRSEGMVIYALLLLTSVSLAWKAEIFEGVLLLFWSLASMRSARHVPFFAIVAAPVAASAFAAIWARAASRAGSTSPVQVFWLLARDLGRHTGVSLWLPACAVIVVATARGATFPENIFPTRAVDANLLRLTRTANMPRILTSDQWADYLIFRLYPRQRVFFDGRSDFFGPAIGSDYRKLLAAESSWSEVMQYYKFDCALLPRDWAMISILDREPEWRRVYQDSQAVFFIRRSRQDSGEIASEVLHAH